MVAQSACCRGITPVSLRGWAYLAVWGAVVVLPMAGLAALGKVFPEAPIWLAFSTLAFLWDMRDIRGQLQAEHDRNLFYIPDEEADTSELATRHFDMKLRG